MRTSGEGRAALRAREGLRLAAYRDGAGIWTIGYGHTSAAGPPEVRPGLAITAGEADAILARDLAVFEAAVGRAVRVPLAQGEFDALVSLCFNIGPGAFARSTLARRLKAGDRAGAAEAFLLWNRAGGRVVPGLARRRREERDQFLTGGAGSATAQPDRPAPASLAARLRRALGRLAPSRTGDTP